MSLCLWRMQLHEYFLIFILENIGRVLLWWWSVFNATDWLASNSAITGRWQKQHIHTQLYKNDKTYQWSIYQNNGLNEGPMHNKVLTHLKLIQCYRVSSEMFDTHVLLMEILHSQNCQNMSSIKNKAIHIALNTNDDVAVKISLYETCFIHTTSYITLFLFSEDNKSFMW